MSGDRTGGSKMEKKYQVTIRNFAWVTYTVQAESKERAEYLAAQKKNEGKEPPDKAGASVQVEVIQVQDNFSPLNPPQEV